MKNLSFLTLFLFWGLWGALYAQVEPNAGTWKTWFISSGKAYRLSAPKVGKEEVSQVLALQKNLSPEQLKQITYWNAGAPGYRWQNMMAKTWMTDAAKHGITANMLLSVAIYDATIAAWDTKYAYNRPRPYEVDKRVQVYAPKPASPSYPCEHSVAAGVAVTVFAHFFPALADSVKKMAQQAMESRVAAGLAFPSDTQAGFELGKKIAEIEIKHTANYLNNTPWDGKMPEKPGLWRGRYAMMPHAGKSKTIALDSGSQFRPLAPPDFAKEMEELRNYKQTFSSIANAFFYANEPFWDEVLNQKIFEYNLHLNAPRAARMYALSAIGYYDGFIACWDAKFAYWGIRPDQYDPNFKPLLIHTPPFPGYPSGHAAVSSVTAELYAYFFPTEAAWFRSKAQEVAESRFQGGIHFRSDNEVALDLGKKVAGVIIEKAKIDGAEMIRNETNTQPKKDTKTSQNRK
ncbi:MAG: phosphatase PAP2 family protein [Microscillaceae bacterium]|jgi:membrane-associated phospholipid phosphatase|nr:phosphatase PAP2 family protein [Microscillaceae bacterium]